MRAVSPLQGICHNAVGETKAHPGPPYSHHLILITSLPRVEAKRLWRMCARSFKCHNWTFLAWSWDQGLREIGASAAVKVSRACPSCSEKTPVLFQHVRQRDSRSWVRRMSGGLVRAGSIRGQSQWWEALWSSPKDALQLHLQVHIHSHDLLFSGRTGGSLTEQNNLEILQWMKRFCVRDLVTALGYSFGEKTHFWNGFQLGPFQPQSITFNYLPGAQGIRHTLINSTNMQIVSSFVISTVCSWHSCYEARL